MINEEFQPEKLPLKRFFSQLSLKSCWSIILIVSTLLTGAFSLGYQIRSSYFENKQIKAQTIYETRILNLENDISQLEARLNQYRGLEEKERFVSLYLRFLLAKEAFKSEQSLASKENYYASLQSLDECVGELWNLSKTGTDLVQIRGLVIGKSALAGESTIKFNYDGTIWPIPEELQIRYKMRE